MSCVGPAGLLDGDAVSLAGAQVRGSPTAQVDENGRIKRRQNGPHDELICFRCWKSKKKCIRPLCDKPCQLCRVAGVRCGVSLTKKERKVIGKSNQMASPSALSSFAPGQSMDHSHIDDHHLPTRKGSVDSSESWPSSEDLDTPGNNDPAGLKLFKKDYSGDHPLEWWSQKLEYLLHERCNLKCTYNTTSYAADVNFSAAFIHLKYSSQRLEDMIEYSIRKLYELAQEVSVVANDGTVERIFLQIFRAIKEAEDIRLRFRFTMLREIASSFERTHNHPPLQRILRHLLLLAVSPKVKPKFVSDIQRMMARSIQAAAPVIKSSFVNRDINNPLPAVDCPALHQSIHLGDFQVFKIVLENILDRNNAHANQPHELQNQDFPDVPRGPTPGLDDTDTLGRAPLCIAVLLKRQDICEALITAGAKLDMRDDNGHTTVEIAAGLGLVETVELMLSHALNLGPEAFDAILYGLFSETSTPLQAAAGAGHLEVVRLLLRSGGRTDLKVSDALSATAIASKKGHHAIAEAIERWRHSSTSPNFPQYLYMPRVSAFRMPPFHTGSPAVGPSTSRFSPEDVATYENIFPDNASFDVSMLGEGTGDLPSQSWE